MILPITLTLAGAAALLNIWIAQRVGRARVAHKVSIGDGGNDALTGSDGVDAVTGGTGDDLIAGHGGDDEARGGGVHVHPLGAEGLAEADDDLLHPGGIGAALHHDLPGPQRDPEHFPELHAAERRCLRLGRCLPRGQAWRLQSPTSEETGRKVEAGEHRGGFQEEGGSLTSHAVFATRRWQPLPPGHGVRSAPRQPAASRLTPSCAGHRPRH